MTINMITKRSGIKSIQRGTIGSSTTATISAVVTAKSFVLPTGCSYSTTGDMNTGHGMRLALTNTTTVTSTGGSYGGINGTMGFVVVEFY